MNDLIRPYQKEGINWLRQKRFALLADEMGLGKTLQILKACELKPEQKVLIICPAIARINWQREIDKWINSSLDCENKSLLSKIVTEKKHIKDCSTFTIVSYDFATLHPALFLTPWRYLILDEAHYLKEPGAKRTKAILGSKGIARKASFIFLMTGTPMPNHPGELYVMMKLAGIWAGTHRSFLERYCNLIHTPYGIKIAGAKKETWPELKTNLQKIMLRRKKIDVMKDLPPIIYDEICVPKAEIKPELFEGFLHYIYPQDLRHKLKEDVERQYKMIEASALLFRNDTNYGRVADNFITNLASIFTGTSTARRYIGCQKIKGIADIVREELENNAYQKIVIFALHRDVIEGLRVELVKFKPVTLYGGTDPAKRQRNIDKFQNNPRCRIFIGNIRACGTAINLTAANQVLFAEADWTPGNNAQAAMRCHRIGQTLPVHVRFVSVDDPIDDAVTRALRLKTADQLRIVG